MENVNFERDFNRDCATKKKLARADSHRVKCKRGRMKMPSDYLSAAEKKLLNGEVITMSLDEPISYEKFIKLSTQSQKIYLENLISRFSVPCKEVASMMGVNQKTLASTYHRLGVSGPGKGRHSWAEDEWLLWLDKETDKKKTNNIHFKSYTPAKPQPVIEEPAVSKYEKFTLDDLKISDIKASLKELREIGINVRVNVEIS